MENQKYYYDPRSLDYIPHKDNSQFIYYGILITLSVLGFATGRFTHIKSLNSIEHRVLISREDSAELAFTPEKFRDMLNVLNLKNPNIVYAQAMLESSNFTSDIFIENYNLFGMKEAKVRPTTALGTSKGHAYYSSWQNSVIDYAFYQATYLKNIKSDKEYYECLIKLGYAKDPDYISKLKAIVKNLKHE